MLVFLLSTVFWSHYLYKPLPEGLGNPWKVRLIISLFKIVEDLSELTERLGLSTKIHSIRLITNMLSSIMTSDSTGITVRDTVFGGVKVRVYEPTNKAINGAGLVFYHGGGWFFCNVDVHDHMTRTLARRLNIVVISVDYRLAPEHPYPIPLNDCLTATKYFINNAAQFDVDPGRVAIMGDSAGGNLAAAVALDLRQTGYAYQPKQQILVYPALQAIDMTLPSFIDNDNIVYGSRRSMTEVLLYYMGEDIRLARHLTSGSYTNIPTQYSKFLNRSILLEKFPSKKDSFMESTVDLVESLDNPDVTNRLRRFALDPLFAPLMAESLNGLPSAYIITAQFDVLRDEGLLYAERLRQSGVNVTWAHYDEAFHGFWALFNPPIQLDVAVTCMNDLVLYLRLNL